MVNIASELRHLAFAREYLRNGYNAKLAYKTIFPKVAGSTATNRSNALMKTAEVQAILSAVKESILEDMKVDEARVLKELACIAFFDIKDVLNNDGTVKPVDEMPERARRAIAGMDLSEVISDGGVTAAKIKKLKPESKLKALELIGRNLGTFDNDNNINLNIDIAKVLEDLNSRGGGVLEANEKPKMLADLPDAEAPDFSEAENMLE